MFPPASSSARSNDSSDSGIYDLDDDYSFVITENSPPELVQRVVADFTPVENLGDDQGLLGRSPAGGRGEAGNGPFVWLGGNGDAGEGPYFSCNNMH